MLQPTGERLDSWKEIAEYLRRDLRTVRRWEDTRGLPVRRVPGSGRSAVYAFRNEIDTWLLDNPLDSHALSQEHSVGNSQRQKVLADVLREGVAERIRPTSVKRWVSAAVFLAAVCTPLLLHDKLRSAPAQAAVELPHRLTTSNDVPPKITSVSPILPQRDQRIIITGSGFGLHVPYENADNPFIAVRNDTAGWAAGRIIAENWDAVTLNVESWRTDRIVISGFSGAYGSGKWKLTSGDEIEIAVWNPQSANGPALYRLKVSRAK
jgi:hypothetical protein